MPLQMDAYQSFFIVFRRDLLPFYPEGENCPEPEDVAGVTTPWKVRFDTTFRGPAYTVLFPQLTDWSLNANDSIRNYSGSAVYTNTFRLPKDAPGGRLYLDLGMVRDMAKVRVNGIYVGGVWTAPYRVDITSALKPGENHVEITVVNTWVNRLIGDSRLPAAERKTWLNANPYQPNSPYEPAGLLGPVRVVALPY